MIHAFRLCLALVAFTLSPGGLSAQSASADQPDTQLDVAGTVVIHPGLGVVAGHFDKVLARLDGFDIYDKGRPKHDIPGDEDGLRSAFDVARYVRADLDAEGLPPPYTVVGHSVGGAHALAFAQLYPEDTRALILVDPRLPWFDPSCHRAGLRGCGLPANFRERIGPRLEAEYDGMSEGMTQLLDMRPLERTPATLLIANKPPRGFSKKFQAHWVKVLVATAHLMPDAVAVIVDGGHGLHKSHPDLVAEAITRGRLAPRDTPADPEDSAN